MATISNTNDASTMDITSDEDLPTPSDTATIVAPQGDKHTHTVIFMHGREDCGTWFAQDFFDLKSSDGRTLAEIFPSIRWVFPTAKRRFSARYHHEFENSSFKDAFEGEDFDIISQWFDIWDVRDPEDRKELMLPGLQESIRQITDIIIEEAQIIPLERIILGGISQGCATSILALLSSELNLGGFIGWCGFLPFQRSIEALNTRTIGNKHELSGGVQGILGLNLDDPDIESSNPSSEDSKIEARVGTTYTVKEAEINQKEIFTSDSSMPPQAAIKTPIFLAHSEDDEVVPCKLGDDLGQIIKHLGFNVTWKKYIDGMHQIHPDHGVDDMSLFIQRALNIYTAD
jgi:lysophospholipase-2